MNAPNQTKPVSLYQTEKYQFYLASRTPTTLQHTKPNQCYLAGDEKMFPIVDEGQHLSSQLIIGTTVIIFMTMMMMMMMATVKMMRRMLPTAQEDKIFRAVSSPLLLDKFSCVEDDRTEGRAHLTRRLLLLLQHHFIIF